MQRRNIAIVVVLALLVLVAAFVAFRRSTVGQAGTGTNAPQSLPHDSKSASDEAIALLQRGDVDEAVKLRRDHLKKDPSDLTVRVLLGQAIDFDGRPEEAIQVWKDGLNNSTADEALLTQIGNRHARLAEDGPTVTRRRGVSTTSPDRDPEAAVAFRKKHWAAAISAFEKATALFRNDATQQSPPVGFWDTEFPDYYNYGPESALAHAYAASGNHSAAEAMWRELHESCPDDRRSLFGYATALVKLGESSEAIKVLEKFLAADPQFAEGQALLAAEYRAAGRVEEAQAAESKAEFYNSLPPFTKLDDSLEIRKLISQLDDRAVVERLCADPSDRATQLLAVLCWQHPHNELEDMAFASLERRGPSARKVVLQLLEHAGSTCTARSSLQILAKQKYSGIFDRLVLMLPGDVRSFGFDMDIAGSLDLLGDKRAVPHLVKVLKTNQPSERADPFTVDYGMNRVRCALALGAFNTPESRQALEEGAKNPELELYCAAALFRLSRDRKHLKRIESASTDGLTQLIVGNYLAKVDDPRAKSLSAALLAKNRQSRDR